MTEGGRGKLDLAPMPVVTGVVSLGKGETGGSVGVVYGEGHLFPKSKVLESKEYEVVVVLGATQHKVGSWSGIGAGSFTAFFLYAIEDLGRKLVSV